MPAQDIAYVELYTGEHRSALDYFVSSLGFTPAAVSQASTGHSVLLRQGEVRLVVTEGPSTRAFLDAHGDGIADIAFSCDDVRGTRDAALAAGASPVASEAGQVVVSGFGDTRHTLVAAADASRLPAGRDWREIPPAAAESAAAESAAAGFAAPAWIRLLDHVAVCVTGGTLADCADFYIDGFGLSRYSGEYTELGEQAMDSLVVRSSSGGITFTLLEQDMSRKPGQIEGFISRNDGPGVQHLAFEVGDIIPAVREFSERGIEFLHTPDRYYDMLASRLPGIEAEIADLRAVGVLADRDEWGYLLQVFTRSPYRRNTMFYEFIQRRGARGFGGANIKALYQAVERDGLAGG
jgi:4-hydroxymandelate synthase